MPVCITKSNKFKDLEIKLLRLSYLSNKILNIFNCKNYLFMCAKLERKKFTPKKCQKLNFQTLKTTTSTHTTLPYKNTGISPGGILSEGVCLGDFVKEIVLEPRKHPSGVQPFSRDQLFQRTSGTETT